MFFSKEMKHIAFILAVFFCLPAGLMAQQAASVRGVVADPTGAVIPGAIITLTSAKAEKFTATSGGDGTYQIRSVPQGVYQLTVSAGGFAAFLRAGVIVTAGTAKVLDVKLEIEVQQQNVEVTDNGATLDTSSGSNASALVISGKDLDALSDDPDELSNELQALAGPSAGPNGGQIYVDGFTGSQIPPKSSIREIRVNQNPFSAQYDALGYGRIEILTKPGTDKFHGQINVNGNANFLNTTWSPIPPPGTPQTPQPEAPGYHSTMVMANVSGPLSKKASFFFSYNRRGLADNSLVNATILNSSFEPEQFVSYVGNPRTRLEISPRIDYQIAPNNTLTFRYEYSSNSETNDGVGQFNLPSVAYNSTQSQHNIQIGDTQIFGSKVINETRFQWVHTANTQTPQSSAQTLVVQGNFTDGGNSQGKLNDSQNHYEFQNYTSLALGSHTVKFGVRLRDNADLNTSYQNFNGTYTFSSLDAYQITLQGQQNGLTPTEIRALGGGASQFNQVVGNPTANANVFDAGLYAEDDWKVRPNLTLSYGLRFESQTQINDHADFAPRLGVAWGIGKNKNGSPKAIVRGGFGIFYDRFLLANVLQADRQNGVNQTSFGIINPDTYPDPPDESGASSTAIPGQYQIGPKLHASYTAQTGVSFEKQVTKTATVAVTYLNSHGGDGYLTRDVNAPLPGTYDPANPVQGRPNGKAQNIYQYDSQGTFNQNQLITNMNMRATKGLSLFGFYVLNFANADSSGVNSQPSLPYNVHADYGRASYDIRQRLFLGGSATLPHQFVLSPFMVASSGSPFNITTGTDLVGDLAFNNRPAYATSQSDPKNVVATKYGNLDIDPAYYQNPVSSGQTLVPSYLGTGTAHFTFNLRLAKNFGFGPKTGAAAAAQGGGQGGPPGGGFGIARGGPGGGGGGRGPGGGGFGGPGGAPTSSHRYNLSFSVQALNLFNVVNLGVPNGIVTSNTFGEATSLAGQIYSSSSAIRRVFLQTQFSF